MAENWNAGDADFADEDVLRTAAIPLLRLDMLAEAARLTNGDRDRTYGTPVENHEHIARIFNAITGRDLSAAEVVMVHVATKLARMQTTPDHRDSHVDAMAYLGIRAECIAAAKQRK